MQTAILTIPSQDHRMWALLGHLQTIGFPVVKKRHLIKVYRGYSYTDYPNRYEAQKAMIADGHTKYQAVMDRKGEGLKKIRSFSDCCQWSYLNMLRQVVKLDVPTLVLENDAFFVDVTYEELDRQWESLVSQIGFENINLAICSIGYAKKPELRQNAKFEDVDGFWVKGAVGYSQTAHIFTPHGAQWFLDNLPCYPHIELFVYHGRGYEGYVQVEGVYSTRRDIIDPHFFCNFDSFRTQYHNPDHWTKLVKGEPF